MFCLLRAKQAPSQIPVKYFFVPGTTEKIFESKQNLFDLYVDQQNLEPNSSMHQRLLELSVADRLKYSHLLDLRYQTDVSYHKLWSVL